MRLEKTLGKKYVTGNNCEFYIELQLDFKNDEWELEQLQKMCHNEYAKRAKNHKKYHMGLVTRIGKSTFNCERALKSISNIRSQKTWLRFTSSLNLRIQMVLKCEKLLQNALKPRQTAYISTLRNILIHLNVNA